MKLKTLVMISMLSVGSATASTRPMASCELRSGRFDNSVLKPHGSIKIESMGDGFGEFSLMTADKLSIDLFGKSEVFLLKGISVSGGTKLDLSLESHPEQVKAVLLMDKTPARIRRKFNALLVITGADVSFNAEKDTPFFSASSFVYNLKCKTN